MTEHQYIAVEGAFEHNLKGISLKIPRGKITVVTGVSGSGKSSLAFDTVLAESQRRFFYTLSHYSRQFLDLGSRPAVRRVAGLSPAIALAQNETQPSRRATVGTLTDLGELFSVMFARFGTQYCPEHGSPTSAGGTAGVVDRILAECDGQTVALAVPVATSKKGTFRAQMTKFAEKGYLRAFIDGEMASLSPVPELAREEKHTIKLIIDQIRIKPTARERVARGVDVAIEEGQGFAEYFVLNSTGQIDPDAAFRISTRGGCPDCGFSWPQLDARYFSPNSLGRCPSCVGLGMVTASGSKLTAVGAGNDPLAGTLIDSGDDTQDDLDSVGERTVSCAACSGTGVTSSHTAVKLGATTIHDVLNMPLRDITDLIVKMKHLPSGSNQAFLRVQKEAIAIAERINSIGLGYLTMARRIRSLSGGESQRLKLAGILSESLRGVLYVLDEPSQGLHPSELEMLWGGLVRLRDQGNTILIVDHDDAVMRRADLIVDLGPGGGADGGRLLAQFAPSDAGKFVKESRTAWHLAESNLSQTPAAAETSASSSTRKPASFFSIKNCHLHNLKIPQVDLAKGALNVVTGVSGAGKSSLVLGTFMRNATDYLAVKKSAARRRRFGWFACEGIAGIDDVENLYLIDRKPVAKSSISMPASYLDVFGLIRDLYAKLPEAQIAGLSARNFSLNTEGGRCEECRGRGEVALSMRFLSDARVRCPVCEGRRYQPPVLSIDYKGTNIAEALDLTIDQALELFASHRLIVRRLTPAQDLGLGYLKLGQPSASLSGGEAQRLKMVPFLTKKMASGTVLVMDEPTTGLHFDDVGRLLGRLKYLVQLGATVVVVEHNSEIIRASDWIVDLGPGSAENGGRVVYQGFVAGLVDCRESVTGRHLTADRS